MNNYKIHSLLWGISILLALGWGTAQAAPLALDDAVRLALDQQPQIQAEQAQARANRAAAVAEGQLPDPKLMLGVKDLPINGPAAYSLRRDDFTMMEVGISQDFPRGGTRHLQAEKKQEEADVSDAMVAQLRREIRRDVGFAWLEVFLPERSAALVESQQREAALFAQAVEVAFRTGRSSQADLLNAKVAVELLADKAAEFEQRAKEARGMLSRWVGNAAQDEIPEALPHWPAPPELGDLLQHVATHPQVEVLAKQEAVAKTDIALAQQGYKPDWGVEAYYANRPDFSDYVGVRVTVGLPLFTSNRQDQRVEESRALLEKTSAQREDGIRMHAGEARAAHAVWEDVSARLARFNDSILPQAHRAVEAAQAAYGAGQSSLSSVLQARQAVLDIELQRLDLEVAAARSQLRLRYFIE